MKKNRLRVLLFVFLIGLIIPFIPQLVVIEGFYLLFPLGVLASVSFIYMIFSLFSKDQDTQYAIFLFSIIPIFFLTQILSGFAVGGIQRFRRELIIEKVEKIKSEKGFFPEKFKTSLGINYLSSDGGQNFRLEYSRGFMVTEEYNSFNKKWKSYGWND